MGACASKLGGEDICSEMFPNAVTYMGPLADTKPPSPRHAASPELIAAVTVLEERADKRANGGKGRILGSVTYHIPQSLNLLESSVL